MTLAPVLFVPNLLYKVVMLLFWANHHLIQYLTSQVAMDLKTWILSRAKKEFDKILQQSLDTEPMKHSEYG